ncbi:MAG: hypothetical protein IJE27_02760 [Anaerotignum sp.]|nr:hypothetical protein [Anaerotignum sp.]
MKKRIVAAATVLALAGTQTAFAADTTNISLFDEKILVNGREITEKETEKVRVVLDGVDITCRTAAATMLTNANK